MHFHNLSIDLNVLQETAIAPQHPLYLNQIKYLSVSDNNRKSFDFKDAPNHHEVTVNTFDHIVNILHAVASPVNGCDIYGYADVDGAKCPGEICVDRCLKPSKIRKRNGDSNHCTSFRRNGRKKRRSTKSKKKMMKDVERKFMYC